MLIKVAAAIQKALRRYDILFRYGGEEFVVIFPELTLAEARISAERIRQICAELPLSTEDGQQIRLTLSGGLTVLQEMDSDADRLLKRADAALYQAKGNGRNRIEAVL